MKKSTVYSMLAGAALFAAPFIASAAQDVVRDERGNVLTNTWDNCVLTDWEGGAECGSTPQEIAASKEQLTVYYGFDSARLTPAAVAKLDRLAGLIGASSSVSDVSIIGYADAIGGNAYNDALSNRRANAVSSYLASKGVNTSGVTLKGLGEGSSKSQCTSSTGNERKACLWRDRRTEIQLNYK